MLLANCAIAQTTVTVPSQLITVPVPATTVAVPATTVVVPAYTITVTVPAKTITVPASSASVPGYSLMYTVPSYQLTIGSTPPPPPPPPPPASGTWVNVTPSSVNLSTGVGGCGNYGTAGVMADSANPGTMYTEFNCQGVWISTDYGVTWTGPVNTGINGTAVTNCQGTITVNPNANPGGLATLYQSCLGGSAVGFWISTDNGVDWTQYNIAPLPANRQDVYPPVIDPYNASHLLMAGHEQNFIVESKDGGHTWTNVALNAGMAESGGTAAIIFIDMGNSFTTATTFLWMSQQGGGPGTWRTTNDGGTWTKVDSGEHGHGVEQIYQLGGGVIYVPQAYSALGWGLLRSVDYGVTFSHVGGGGNLTNAWGTTKNIYGMFGFPIGTGCNNPAFEIGGLPGTGTYTQVSTPAGMCQGSAWVTTVNAGGSNIFLGAMFNSGLWRYVEP